MTALGAVAAGLSVAFVPTALGLIVGLQSLWGYQYLREELAGFDLEMADMAAPSGERVEARSSGRGRRAAYGVPGVVCA